MNAPLDATPSATPGLLDTVAKASIVIASSALLGLVTVQSWQVFARYVLNDSPSWTEPVTLVLLSTLLSFAAAAGVHQGAHFTFSLLVQRASAGVQRLIAALNHGVVICIGLALAVGASTLFIDGLGIRMAGAPIPQSTAYGPLAVGGLLTAIFAFGQLWRTIVQPAKEAR
ncbi:MAG: TRAP transporter small permease [Pseudomarimonas sp.]